VHTDPDLEGTIYSDQDSDISEDFVLIAKSLARAKRRNISAVNRSCDKTPSAVSQLDWSRPIDLQSILLLDPLRKSLESQSARKSDLPDIRAKASYSEFRLSKASLSQKPNTGSEVLIVEEDAFASLALMTQLQVYGIQCDRVSNAVKALTCIATKARQAAGGDGKQCYKVIMIDQRFIEQDESTEDTEEEVLKRIQHETQRWQYPSAPKICLMTSADTSMLQVQPDDDIDIYLTKPIFKTGVTKLLA